MNKPAIRKKLQYIDQNTIESQRSGSGMIQQVSNTAKDISSDMLSQLFGSMAGERSGRQEVSGDLVEGQEIILNGNKKSTLEKQEKPHIKPGIDYIRELLHGDKKIIHRQTQEISAKIQEIIIELKRLTTSSKELQVQFKEVSVAQVPNPGKYHQTFFEWMLIVIKQARMKVEDSGAWLAVAKSKNAKKQYWTMFKKHGTTFGLSNERVVATQTG